MRISLACSWLFTLLLILINIFRIKRQQVGGFLFDVGLLGLCKSTPESAKDVAKHAEDVAKHAEVGQGRCQAYLRCCKPCLHILSIHKYNTIIGLYFD